LGFNQTYECTIVAEGGSTIWKGSAIDCPEIGNEIFLSHSSQEFTQTRGCRSRPITAYGVGIEDNRYVSRLKIMNLDFNMSNESVQCIYSNGTSTIVGTAYIEISTGIHYYNIIVELSHYIKDLRNEGMFNKDAIVLYIDFPS
jgi:hypothetical protein